MPTAPTHAIAAYTVMLLEHGSRYLMLQRAPEKRFAPLRWTGIGGKVERDEFGAVEDAALRELLEETGIRASDLCHLALRRVVLLNREPQQLTILTYFTADLPVEQLPDCNEGTLHWLTAEEIGCVDVIENTAAVLPLVIADQQRDPRGLEPLKLGVAAYAGGKFGGIRWA